MLKQLISALRDRPSELLQDMIGVMAIFFMIFIGLSLPGPV